jgi:hypothetical protein
MESGQTTPDAVHFLALLKFMGDDIGAAFLGRHIAARDPFAALNAQGKDRALEYISLLFRMSALQDKNGGCDGAARRCAL